MEMSMMIQIKARRIGVDTRAQLAAMDVMLFAAIIMLSSSVMVNSLQSISNSNTSNTNELMKERAEHALQVLLRTTVNSDDLTAPGYPAVVSRGGWRPVKDILSEFLYFQAVSERVDVYTELVLERIIRPILLNLTAPVDGFEFKADYRGTVLETDCGFEPTGNVIYARDEQTVSMSARNEKVCFELGIWRL